MLAPKAHDIDFHEVLAKELTGCDEDVRFLVTMEIKRLAQPCLSPIDLRLLVEEDCEIKLHEGIKHYLSEEGAELFEHLLSHYLQYTVGVKEGVLAYFSKQRDIELGKTKKDAIPADDKLLPKTFISPIQAILEYPSRKDERLLVDIEIRVFLSSTVLLVAKAIDISKNGLRFTLDDETELTLIKGYRPVQVVFIGLGKASKLDTTPIAYRITNISKGNTQANIHLQREWNDGPKVFNTFIEDLFDSIKKRDAIDTINTQTAIESKVYEQAFSLTCQGLSLFINTTNLLKPYIDYACFNDFNIDILDYWQDEDNQQTIGYLLGTERLKQLLLDSDSERYMIIYCFNHIKNGKVYFYSATARELEQSPDLKDAFLSYASRKASWKVFKLDCHQIDPQRGYLPTSLPNGVSRAITQLNRGMPPKLVAALTPLSHMITLTDITHSEGHESYHGHGLEKDKIKLLSLFGHAKNRPPGEIKVLKFAWFDKRRERRYKLRTDVEILCNQSECKGVSEDISTRGLKLELDNNVKTKTGDTIFVSFPNLQDITQKYELIALPYKVMRVSEDGYVLNLQAAENDESQTAKLFFSMLIDNNRERLQALPSDQAIVGLRQALRSLQAKYSPQLCIYTHQQKDTHYPVKTAVNLSKALSFRYLRHNMPAGYLDLSCIFQIAGPKIQYVAHALNYARKHQTTVSHELYIIYDISASNMEDAIRCMWDPELPSHIEKYQFIKSALKDYEFFACRVTSTPKQKPITTLYDDELDYLRKSEAKIAKSLDALAWSFSGQIFLTDITAEVLLRYKLIQD